MVEWLPNLVTVLTALIGAVGTAYIAVRKVRSETQKAESESAASFRQDLRDTEKYLRDELERVTVERNDLQSRVIALEGKVLVLEARLATYEAA